MKKLLYTIGFCLAILFTANTQTTTWTGASGTTDWTDAGNWDNGLPATGFNVVIPSSVDVVFSGTSTIARLEIGGGSSSVFTVASGTLTLTGGLGDDVFELTSSTTFIVNNGTIAINHSEDVDAMLVRGNFTNNGTIDIQGSGDHGIRVQGGTFLNTGMITSANCTEDCIEIDDNGGTPGLFTNDGDIIVNPGGDDGIHVQDNGTMFINNGTITDAGTTGGDDIIYPEDTGVFKNSPDGTITLTDGNDIGVFVSNNGTFVNEGVLTVDGLPNDHLVWIDGDGFINNYGTMDLSNSNSGDQCIYVQDQGIFTNEASGQITISNSGNYDIQVDANNSTAIFINEGTVSFIGGGANDCIRLQENGSFDNMATGLLEMMAAGEEGIEMDLPSTFNNYGMISISDSPDHGMEIDGVFNNMAGGVYSCDGATDDGIRMNANGVFNNDGEILIDNSGSQDIETDDAAFNNTSNAIYRPGSSPGDLVIRDDFDMGGATIVFEIDGTSPITDYDVIDNTNDVNTLNLTGATADIIFGFTPADGDCFQIVDGSGTAAGPFAAVNVMGLSGFTYTVDYPGDDVIICVEEAILLPVEFTKFDGESTKNGNELTWETASEINNAGFDVQVSTDASRWKTIGHVEGNGNSNQSAEYAFLDRNPESGDNYYRLKQIDFNGGFEYSNTILISESNNSRNIEVYPNPATDRIFVTDNNASDNTNYQLMDINGKIVWSIDRPVEQISLQDYQPGIYYLFITEGEDRIIKRIVKQ